MRFAAIILTIAAVAVAAVITKVASAQSPAPTPTAPAAVPAPAQIVPSADTDIRLPKVTPKMRRYSRTRYALYFVGTAYGLASLWLVLATRLSTRLRKRAERLSRRRFLTLFWYYLFLSLALTLLSFPLRFYSGFWMERVYGLSHQSFARWLGDYAKGWAVDLAITVPVFYLFFALIRRAPARWPYWFATALIPLVAFGIFLAPLVIDPIFNKFTPMEPGPLRTRIEALAAKAGIPNTPIFVVDKSKQTETTNAYVTGIGSSARIVLWDTTLNRMDADEIVAIVGHEMGHYVEKHIYIGFALTCAGLFIALPLSRRLLDALLARYGKRWGIDGPGDIAAVPAFLLVLSLLEFFAAPAANAVSRYVEHRADAYGLAVTGDRTAMARSFVKLSEQNLSEPDPPPFITFWLFSHPPLKERIEFALGHEVGR